MTLNHEHIDLRGRLMKQICESYEQNDKAVFECATSIYDSLDMGIDLEVEAKPQHALSKIGESVVRQYGLYRDPTERTQIIKACRFEAPRFFVRRGSELGYHCHVYETIGNKDAGIMLTVVDVDESVKNVFAEAHRVGKVKRRVNIPESGGGELDLIARFTVNEIGQFPAESRRRPSKHATLIASIAS